MTSRAVPAAVQAAQDAIAAEVRGAIGRRNLTHESIYLQMFPDGDPKKVQSWFSRRFNGLVPWNAAELQVVLDIVDEDITRVYAAGALAIEEWRKTNLCLSDSACTVAQRQGLWARRGYELAKRLFEVNDPLAGQAA